MTTTITYLLATALLLGVAFTTSAYDEQVEYQNPVGDQNADLITNLPGLNFPVSFRQYSGYLTAEDSSSPTKFLHYWLVESQTAPDKAPLVLWLNGGPGCSSLFGMFGENGPFSIKENGDLIAREASWNKKANILYLESPTGVGFSYNSADNNELHTDPSSAKQNYFAIKSFFKKFPQFQNRSFYVTGESYGGVYVPSLAVLLDADSDINLRGIAVGNGYLDAALLGKTLAFYTYFHGLASDSLWKEFSTHCCNNKPPGLSTCVFQGAECENVYSKLTLAVISSGINPYNIVTDCLQAPGNPSGKRDLRLYTRKRIDRILLDASAAALFSNQTRVFSTNRFLTDTVEPPCSDDATLIAYLDSPAVKKAIHIPTQVGPWTGPCANILYKMSYPLRPGGMTKELQTLIDSKRDLSILIYNGDLDMMCNFYGDRTFTENLGREVIEDYQPWKLADQLAGYAKDYKGISYVTVKGSGHMVPADKSREAMFMVEKWMLKDSTTYDLVE